MQKFDLTPFLILLLLLWLASTSTQAVADIEAPAVPVSTIEIPLRLSLEPLIDAAEKVLPTQAGNWRRWKNWHGINSQYRAWRGALGVSVSGDVLTVQAHIRYWIKARKKLLGAIKLNGSCGVNEPPRQALIGMQVRLGWGPDWTLRPEFHILPTRFLDRCEMTIANIDVTPLVAQEFRKQMQSSLRAAMQNLAPGMKQIQRQAQRTWSLLQEPLEFGQDTWLLLRPTGVALSPVTGQGNTIESRLAISLQPELVTGPEPAVKPVKLPRLGYHYPRSAGLNLYLGVNLEFKSLNKQLSDALVGRSFVIKGRKAVIKKFDLAGSGQEISARVELTGEAAGELQLQARLAYDAQRQKLALQDLTFDYDAEDFTTDLLAQAFHEPIRKELESAANQALSWHLEQLAERMHVLLDKVMPPGVEFDMSALQLRQVQIHMADQGIRLDGTASGSARLLLR